MKILLTYTKVKRKWKIQQVNESVNSILKIYKYEKDNINKKYV